MTAMTRRQANPMCDDLLGRVQDLLYEYEALGEFERARPHILWLMEIAEKETAAR